MNDKNAIERLKEKIQTENSKSIIKESKIVDKQNDTPKLSVARTFFSLGDKSKKEETKKTNSEDNTPKDSNKNE